MKKLTAIILLISLLAAVLTACGKDNGDEDMLPDVITLAYFEEWMSEVKISEIAEVKTVTEYLGVEPGSLKEITSTSDPLGINEVIDACRTIELRPITKEEAEIDGGVGFTIKLILKSGGEFSVTLNNWNYSDEKGNYYTLDSLPEIPSHVDPSHSYSVVALQSRYDVYDADDSAVGVINGLGDIEFRYYEGDSAAMRDYQRYITTEFGKIYICSETVFRFVDVDMGEEICYELTGDNTFSKLIIKE